MSDNAISKEAAELRRAYYKKWRQNHRETVKETQRRYWERKVQKMKEAAEKR